ncbi:hypothetical protein AMS68_006351 [Peltaster fructicola]|uniref:Uncharacterized protein n=1 Tax=Peltaster fructicola TaxID=286661 RepID=A0A6H0Y1F3_9PEZI|nr:hypothetical protein AMS68_006351 [Peltaster fructicola]
MAGRILSTGSTPGSAASSPYRVPVQLPRSNSRKSPPLAFERTPNDALAPLISPPENLELDPFSAMSPHSAGADTSSAFLQDVVDKQATALHALHTAFAAERDAWACERRQLFQRVANLEKLLRTQNGHSPAKSPIISPTGSITSPLSRAVSTAARLPSIAENENLKPLSERREHAPRTITIPTIQTVEEQNGPLAADLSYTAAAQLDELGVSPPQSAKALAPPLPKDDVAMASSTKHHVRPPTPPPRDMTLIGVEDTPTRNNTHINALLTQSSDEEGDAALKGPLNMPELPSKPSAHNFTEEMLLKKLQHIAQNPTSNKPTIFSIPSPGLAIAEEDGLDAGLSPVSGLIAASTEAPLAPNATRDPNHHSVTSPTSLAQETTSPTSGAHDSDHDQKFEQGGIRLKKKPSTNFGLPFGQLGGFGGLRKMS